MFPGFAASALALVLFWPSRVQASLLSGETLDAAANAVAWVAIIIVPVVVIAVFWIVHILPEKIAEKNKHPQTNAIKIVCLLSLFFGGMLWPIAWIWAYSKPVLHKLAYGTDVDDSHHGGEALTPLADAKQAEPARAPGAAVASGDADEVAGLRRRISSLEMQLAAANAQSAGRSGRTPEEGST